MKLLRLAATATLISALAWVGLTDSAEARRRGGGSSSNLFDKVPNPDPNPDVTFTFNDAVLDSDASSKKGLFIGAVENFSYLRPGTDKPFFDDGSFESTFFFFNDSGNITSSLNESSLQYSIEVNSLDSAALTYDFQYELEDIKTNLIPGISDADIKQNLVNSLDGFFNLVLAKDSSGRLPSSTKPCRLFAPCKFFNEDFHDISKTDFLNKFDNIADNNLDDFLMDGGDPGGLQLLGEIQEVETVPEPGILLGLISVFSIFGIRSVRQTRQESSSENA